MNRGQLIRQVAENTGVPAAKIDLALTELLDEIAYTLRNGEEVNIRRFGKFEPRKRNAVTRRNPKTGEPIDVPAKISVGFVPSMNLKAELNRRKGLPRRGRQGRNPRS